MIQWIHVPNEYVFAQCAHTPTHMGNIAYNRMERIKTNFRCKRGNKKSCNKGEGTGNQQRLRNIHVLTAVSQTQHVRPFSRWWYVRILRVCDPLDKYFSALYIFLGLCTSSSSDTNSLSNYFQWIDTDVNKKVWFCLFVGYYVIWLAFLFPPITIPIVRVECMRILSSSSYFWFS